MKVTICGHGSGFPSLKDLNTYCANRYRLVAPNGKRKGLVAVRRLKGFNDAERQIFKVSYQSILGRNYYSQSLREHVFIPYNGKYYSDCSSSGDACYRRAGHNVGWLNTAGIYESSKFESVPVIIKDGVIQNPEVLKVGDALLFGGNDPARPLQIGHVEFVYEIESGWHWVHVGNDWYYQDADGRNSYGWQKIKETGGEKVHWYFFNAQGRMETGLKEIEGKLYCLMPSGGLEGACCRSDDNGALYVWDV